MAYSLCPARFGVLNNRKIGSTGRVEPAPVFWLALSVIHTRSALKMLISSNTLTSYRQAVLRHDGVQKYLPKCRLDHVNRRTEGHLNACNGPVL